MLAEPVCLWLRLTYSDCYVNQMVTSTECGIKVHGHMKLFSYLSGNSIVGGQIVINLNVNF